MHKHEPHHEAGNIQIVTEEQVNERRHNAEKAIMIVERNARCNAIDVGKHFAPSIFKHLIAKMVVAEAHSAPRVTDTVKKMGLRAGCAFDNHNHGS